jgi:hypothetical protein
MPQTKPFLIKQYLAAIWADWTSRMSGIAGLIFLGAALVFGLTEVAQARYWIGAAVACYVLASFQAWKRERHAIANLQGEIEKLRQGVEGLTQAEGATALTPEQLVGVYKNRTTLQGEKLASTYIGKWMTVSGVVEDISKPRFGISLVFYRGEILIVMYFEESATEPVSALSRGDTVTVRGKIKQIESRNLLLESCELVKF